MTGNLKAVLFDLEGVLYAGRTPVPGAAAAVAEIVRRGLGTRFLTNTTLRSRREVEDGLAAMGMAVPPGAVVTPAMAATVYLRREGLKRVHLSTVPALREDFAGFEIAAENPEAVVMGDIDDGYDRDRLSRLTEMLLDGARLIALHKNRLSRPAGDLIVDLGPYVAALEYAAGTEAVVLGKPSADFFAMALADLGVAAGEAVMVGDDVHADIAGARAAGLRAVLVRTGKYDPRTARSAEADATIDSVADFPSLVADW